CQDHVNDAGSKGIIGHGGSDGSERSDRSTRYSEYHLIGEYIAYNCSTAEEILIKLLIDEGNADRGHRNTIFNAEYIVCGVACGPHKTQQSMCVIDYAKSIVYSPTKKGKQN